MKAFIVEENGACRPHPIEIRAKTPLKAAERWANDVVSRWGPGDGRDQLDILVTLEGEAWEDGSTFGFSAEVVGVLEV